MRVVVDGDALRLVCVAGRALVRGRELEWSTPLDPRARHASFAGPDEVAVPAGVQRALEAAGDVVDAQPRDDRSIVAVRRGATGLELVVADAAAGTVEVLTALAHGGVPTDAFAPSAGQDANDAPGDAVEEGEAARSVRLVVRGGRVGIGAAGSGHAAVYDVSGRRWEFALRLPTGSLDLLTVTPLDHGALLAAQWSGRWLELAVVAPTGAVVSRWPAEDARGETYGLPECAVVGDAVVVCCDTPRPTAVLLSLPTLGVLDEAEVPECRVDLAPRGSEVFLLGMERLVRLTVDGARLRADAPGEWIDVFTRDEAPPRCAVAEGYEAVADEVAGRVEAVGWADGWLTRAYTDGRIEGRPGGPGVPPWTGRGRRRILDVQGPLALVAEPSGEFPFGGEVVRRYDLRSGEGADVTEAEGAAWARLCGDAVLLGVRRYEGFAGFTFDGRDEVRLWRPGEPTRSLASLPGEAKQTAGDGHVVALAGERGDGGWLCRTAGASSPQLGEPVPLDRPATALAVEGDLVVAVLGDADADVVWVDARGEIVRRAEQAIRWAGGIRELSAGGGAVAWTEMSAERQPLDGLLVLDLDAPGGEPREILTSGFGALTHLAWHDGAWCCLESPGPDGGASRWNALVPRSRVVRVRPLGAER
jgi:hypothetical protein